MCTNNGMEKVNSLSINFKQDCDKNYILVLLSDFFHLDLTFRVNLFPLAGYFVCFFAFKF